MANIFLTRKCNLNCPYCFASEFVNKENEEVTLENFNKILNFIKADGTERVGLIGGEPLVYSHFKEIIEILISDEQIKTIVIYTNGINLDKYFDILGHEKISCLINCNSEKDIGTSQYEKLKNNILKFKEINKKFKLGINLYSKDMDYSYIFDLLKLAEGKELRFSTALPNDKKEKTKNILKGFEEMHTKLFEFLEDCLNNNIVPYNDCNAIPDCLLTVENKRLLLKLGVLAKKNNLTENMTILSSKTCHPVIDILPDLNAVRCFGLSKYMKVPITNFKSLTGLINYFHNKIDLYARLSFVNKNCEDCKSRFMDKCGICFTYKLHKIEDLRKHVYKHT